MSYNTACANNGVVANAYSRTHCDVSAKPYVVTHIDGKRPLLAGIAALGIYRVAWSVERAVGADEYMVAKGNLGLIEDYHVGIGKEILTYFNVESVVAKEWLQHLELFTCPA